MPDEGASRDRLYGTQLVVAAVAVAVFAGPLVAEAVPAGAASGAVGAAIQQDDPGGLSGSYPLGEADATLPGEAANDTAGWSIAPAGDVNGDGVGDVLVGAPRNDLAGPDAGAVYLFFGPVGATDLDPAEADVTLYGESRYDLAGWSVSTAGDLDEDGYDDVVVGAPFNDRNGFNAGAAYVVHGGPDLPAEVSLGEADAVLAGSAANDSAGWAVTNVSDAGPDAVLVGAPFRDGSGVAEGAAYLVYNGTMDGEVDLAREADARLRGESGGNRAGWSVADLGDVDGDGFGEVAVGAPYRDASSAGVNAGAVHVVDLWAIEQRSSRAVDLGDTDATLVGEESFDRAGYDVAGGGDVTGDGTADVVVGAPFNDRGATSAGTAYVVAGGGIDGEVALGDADVALTGESAFDNAGRSVATAGPGCDDVDDVLVGAPSHDTGGDGAGAAYLVAGNASLGGSVSLSEADATAFGSDAGDQAGYAVAGGTDLDGDTVSDVLVGAPYRDTANGSDAGAAYVLLGECASVDATPVDPETPTPTPTETPGPTATGTATGPDATETATGTDATDDPQTDLRVLFFGCGNVEVTGPDEQFPMDVTLVVYNPGQDEIREVDATLDEGERPGSPGGLLTGIDTPGVSYYNPNFDFGERNCGDSEGQAEGVPGDPREQFPDGEAAGPLDRVMPVAGAGVALALGGALGVSLLGLRRLRE